MSLRKFLQQECPQYLSNGAIFESKRSTSQQQQKTTATMTIVSSAAAAAIARASSSTAAATIAKPKSNSDIIQEALWDDSKYRKDRIRISVATSRQGIAELNRVKMDCKVQDTTDAKTIAEINALPNPLRHKSFFDWYYPNDYLRVERELMSKYKILPSDINSHFKLSKKAKHEWVEDWLKQVDANSIILKLTKMNIQYCQLPIITIVANDNVKGFTELEIYQKVMKYYSDYMNIEEYGSDYTLGSARDCGKPVGLVYDKETNTWYGESSK